MSLECCQCHEEIPVDEQDLLICEECWSQVADAATEDYQCKLEQARQRIVTLEKAINDIMPRYVELLEATGLADKEQASVGVQIAKAAMGY